MSENTRVVSRIKHIWEVIMCPYEDKSLAFWIKVVFGFIWAISIPNGIIYGAPDDYIISLIIMVTVLFINIMVSRFYYRTWIDAIVCIILSIPVFYVYYHASIGYFSVMFSMIFACGIVFVLGIRNSIVLNFVFLIMVIVCFRLNVDMSAKFIYGDNITLRFPYLFICFVLISYCLMYIIQRYWVEKRKRNQILEERVHDEKKKLESMSMKVIDTMSKALAAKIPGEEEHYLGVAAFAREIALREGMDEQQCADAYSAGLLHEIGMIGIPDALIRREDLSDEEYKVFQTYVQKGYQIITTLHSTGRSEIADAVHYHREAYDGNGFLEGLAGEKIPKLARVLAVADYADRHLRRGESPMQVAKLILEQQNRLFEPQSARIMAQMLQEHEHEISIVHK